MNSKQAKRLRQLVRYLTAAGKIESKEWLAYDRDTRYEEIQVPNILGANAELGANGKHITTTRTQLIAVGTRKMDPSCGRAIYQSMKKVARARK